MRHATFNGYEIGWHHTSLEGAVGILRNNYVWASWATSLNDTKEVLHGAKIVKEAADRRDVSGWPEEIRKLVDDADELKQVVQRDAFVFSVSEHEDSLRNWAIYGPIALGFAMSTQHRSGSAPILAVIDEPWSGAGSPRGSRRPAGPSTWHKIVYEPRAQEAMAEQALDAIEVLISQPEQPRMIMLAQEVLLQCVLTMKHPDFDDEAERRFIGYRPLNPKSVHYRVSGGSVIPYVRVSANHKDGDQMARGRIFTVSGPQTLPIYVIRVDPHVSDEAVAGLRDLVENRDHYMFEGIERSTSPYRRPG